VTAGGIAVVAASVFTGAVEPLPAVSAAAAQRPPAARRMLVVSLPMVTWAEMPLDRMANLRGLLEQSIVADLSVRGIERHPTLADAYVTISAGTRAVSVAAARGAVARPGRSLALR